MVGVALSRLSERQKIGILGLVVLGPALAFIHWPHPEIFSTVFVLLALLEMDSKRWASATFFSAVASWQNLPLVVLTIFLWLKALYEGRGSLAKNSALVTLAAAPAALPSVFYLVKFGSPSLLVSIGAADIHSMSLWRVWELWGDLNIGMLPYVPLAVGMFFWSVGCDLVVLKAKATSVQLFGVILCMMLMASATTNWNHGTAGPSRYVIWILPIVAYVIVKGGQLAAPAGRYAYKLALVCAIVTQAAIVFYRGGLYSDRNNYIYHTRVATVVLNHMPGLYNPSPEIFLERTLHQEIRAQFAVYYYDKECRKALVGKDDLPQLRRTCGSVPRWVEEFFEEKQNQRRLVYVNYANPLFISFK